MTTRKESSSRAADAPAMLWDGPDAGIILILGHGAGADMRSQFMEHVASRLGAASIGVCRFNFPFTQHGRRAPDRQPVLEQAFADVVAVVRARRPTTLILGGKSLGGRIASTLAAAGVACDGLVFLGYPLHPPGRPDRSRAAHLPAISAPMLFVEGTRDPFCPLDTLNALLPQLRDAELGVIEGGDHSFKVPAASRRATSEAWDEVADVVAEWIQRLVR